MKNALLWSCCYYHGLCLIFERPKHNSTTKVIMLQIERLKKKKKTHKRSPSVKGGCRASRGKRLMNDAPMFRKTRVMSRIEGSHTLKRRLWCSTTTQRSILVLYQLDRKSTFVHYEVFWAYQCVEQQTERWFAGTAWAVRKWWGLGERTSSEKALFLLAVHKTVQTFPADNCLLKCLLLLLVKIILNKFNWFYLL